MGQSSGSFNSLGGGGQLTTDPVQKPKLSIDPPQGSFNSNTMGGSSIPKLGTDPIGSFGGGSMPKLGTDPIGSFGNINKPQIPGLDPVINNGPQTQQQNPYQPQQQFK